MCLHMVDEVSILNRCFLPSSPTTITVLRAGFFVRLKENVLKKTTIKFCAKTQIDVNLKSHVQDLLSSSEDKKLRYQRMQVDFFVL